MEMSKPLKKAVFGAGCFWGVEKIFAKTPGVMSTSVGYMGGKITNPDYYQVCSGKTGHAEVVEVNYDPTQVSYEELLILFWEWHNPTTLNRQGPDIGTQYRSVIFYDDEEQAATARDTRDILDHAGIFTRPIVTEIVPAADYEYYLAEDYHQKYLFKNPFGYCSHHIISPKIREVLEAQLQRHN
jgi:peptide-methionine (S)-S-oxide reductase